VNYDGYSIAGDGVSDTPAHYGPTEDYVGAESCWTDYVLDTCVDVDGIDPGPDPVDNCKSSWALAVKSIRHFVP
jgi:hypothetical protein